MTDSGTKIWESDTAAQLASVLTVVSDEGQMHSVLRDIMTESEIEEISTRLEAAKLLRQGKTYVEVTNATKLSSRTVARISDWMKNGCGGYDTALELIESSHSHM